MVATERVAPESVEAYLTASGFHRQRNQDYIDPALGIILEDLHDENVLSNNDVLFFIDTAFFLTDGFYLL